jgi:MoaA/NifB/PqqE/SkfB family radical SAM enzyme
LKIIKAIKARYRIKTRIDTNGIVKCMYAEPVKELEQAGLNEIRISLNAINEKEYNLLCKPKFDNVFPNLLKFIKECTNSRINTYVSFVVGFENKNIPRRTKEEFEKFALSLGVKKHNIIFREYVRPI